MEDYYELIGVSRDTEISDIKVKLNRLLLNYHPDKESVSNKKQEAGNSSMFLKIQKAREVLLDSERRKIYDQQLKESELVNNHPISSHLNLEELDFDEDSQEYFTDCRCGGVYVIDDQTVQSCNSSTIHSPCTNCTFYIEVQIKQI